MKKNIIIIFIIFAKFSFSQIGIGEWKTHLPYSNGKKITQAKDKFYCNTENGLFVYNTSDNSTEILSKEKGLSDVTISTVFYAEEKDAIIVGYENGNIDIIKGKTIINISDIKRKQIYGSKSINNIISYNHNYYLATGFGVVNLDIDKYEIKDTYLIGLNSSQKQVFDIIVYNNMFYTATEDGIFTADVNSSNLSFYENWHQDFSIPNPNLAFKDFTIYKNKLYVTQDDDINKLYYLDSGVWTEYEIDGANTYYSINSDEKNLYLCWNHKLTIINSSGNETLVDKYEFAWGQTYSRINYAFKYYNDLYLADANYGIVKLIGGNSTAIKPNGPYSLSFWDIDIFNGKLWATTGGVNAAWNNLYNKAHAMCYNDNWWTNIKLEGSRAIDPMDIVIDRNDDKRVFVSSWNGGIFEIYNGVQVNQYLQHNSSLENCVSTWDAVRVGGLAMDEDGNLWTSGMAVNNQFNVRTTDGQWHGLAYSNITQESMIRSLIVTQDKYKWVTLHRAGIFIFDDKGTYENTDDDDYKKINILDENGDIVSNEVYCVAEDKDGTIWVGTAKGVVTYFYPSDVFTNSSFRGQRVIIEQNGISQYLLETEEISSIAIDGANRKWFGTRNSGVYLISEDGTEELKHFTIDNSPLLSNEISAIGINDKTGEVYFGTSKGLISYRGTATEGNEFFTDVYAYPNPVPPDFNGLIAINGLVENADVKITDISGNLVFETKAEGGQATWNGKNFSGEKVHTGVYLAFCSNEDGSKTFVTKILFIN